MPNDDLVKYIKDGLAMGRTEDVIRSMLSRASWTQKDVDDAFNFIKDVPLGDAPQPSIQNISIQPSVPSTPASGRPRMKTVVIATLILLLMGGGIGYAYYLRSQLTADQVLGKAFVVMQGVKTFSYSVVASSTVQMEATSSLPFVSGTSGNNIALSAVSSGTVDLSDASSVKQSSIFSVAVIPGASTTQSLGGTVEYVSLGGIYYIKLDSLNLGGKNGQASNLFTAILSIFTGQWFKIDPTALAQTFFKDQTDQVAKLQTQAQWSPEKIQQIKNMAAQDSIISVNQALPNEKVGDQDTYHYKLSIDKKNLNDFIAKAYPIIYGENMTDQQLASSTAALDGITYNDIEAWIGTKDFLVYKISADITVAPTPATSDRVQFNGTMGNYNQPSQITVPAGAKDVSQILDGLFGGFLDSTSPASSTHGAPSFSPPKAP